MFGVLRRPWWARLASLLGILLTMGGVPGIAGAAPGPNDSHDCRPHAMATPGGAGVAAPRASDLSIPAELDAGSPDCHRCPVVGCPAMASCAGAMLTGSASASATVAPFPGRRVTLEAAGALLSSAPASPETPPPQPIA